MNHKLSRKIFNIGLLAAVAVALLGGIFMKVWLLWLCVGLLVLNLMQQNAFDRCPHCGEWFNPRAAEPDFCPKCGKNLFHKKGKPILVCHDEACGYTEPYVKKDVEDEEN